MKRVFQINVLANYIGQLFIVFISFAFVPVFVSRLGVEAYALIAFFILIQSWLGLIEAGFSPALSRQLARTTNSDKSINLVLDLIRTIEVFLLFFVILFSLLSFCGSEYIYDNWFGQNSLDKVEVTRSLELIGLVAALRLFESLYKSCLIGLSYQIILNIFNVANSLLRNFGAVIFLNFWGDAIYNFFLWQLTVSLLVTPLLFVVVHSLPLFRYKPGFFKISSFYIVANFSFGLLLINITSTVLTQFDKIFVSGFSSLNDFSFYSIAATASGVIFILVMPITQALFPLLCKLISTDEKSLYVKYFHISSQLITALVGSAALTMFFNSEFLLKTWLGEDVYVSSIGEVFKILLLANMLNSFIWVPYNVLLSHGVTRYTIQLNLVAIFFVLPNTYWVFDKFSYIGVAYVWLFVNIIFLIGIGFMFSKYLPGNCFKWYFSDIFLPLLAVSFASYFFSLFNVSYDYVRFLDLLYVCLAFVITLFFGLISSSNILSVIRGFIKHDFKI